MIKPLGSLLTCNANALVQVNLKQEKNCRKLLGKLDKKSPGVTDIEDCGTCILAPLILRLLHTQDIDPHFCTFFKANSGVCELCPLEPWDDELGVQNFPRKPAKKPPRVERTLTCVVIRRGDEDEDEYLLKQRPNKGHQDGR